MSCIEAGIFLLWVYSMSVKIIEKRTDPTVLKLRHVRDGSDRSMVFCEGEKLIHDLFESSWRPMGLYCAPEFRETAKTLIARHKKQSLPIAVLSESVMKFCSDLVTPPGLIALAKPPIFEERRPLASASAPLLLILHGVQLPQNAGALIRTAEAAGVTEIITTPNTADVFGPKALRGSTGSAFRLPVRRGAIFSDLLIKLQGEKIRSIAATQNGKTAYDEFNWNQPVALIVGSEGAGFTDKEIQQFDETVAIPMKGRVESLNVGIAAAICLFEAARQRRRV